VACPEHDGAIACLRGMTVAVDESEFPLLHPGATADDLDRMIDGARGLWGDLDLRGWTVVVRGGWFVCNAATGPVFTSGCTEIPPEFVRVANDGAGRSCDVATFLHEYGHMTGIASHADPRFAQADALKDQLCPKVIR
jgi:hypothetical protein